MKTILDLNNKKAREFFKKPTNYCSIDLPDYFTFDQVLADAAQMLSNNSLEQLCRKAGKHSQHPCDEEGVNFDLFNNKKSKYQWRKLEIIHPVV